MRRDLQQDTGGGDLGTAGTVVAPRRREMGVPAYGDRDDDGVLNDIPDEATHRYAARMAGGWHHRP